MFSQILLKIWEKGNSVQSLRHTVHGWPPPAMTWRCFLDQQPILFTWSCNSWLFYIPQSENCAQKRKVSGCQGHTLEHCCLIECSSFCCLWWLFCSAFRRTVLQSREIRRNFRLISFVSVIDCVPELYCLTTVDLFLL
jgi:hypothetical protein